MADLKSRGELHRARAVLRPVVDDLPRTEWRTESLVVFREDVERAWTLISAVDPALSLRVVTKDGEWEADDPSALEDLVGQRIDRIEIAGQQGRELTVRRGHYKYPSYAELGWGRDDSQATQREAMRRALEALVDSARARTWRRKHPIWFASVALASVLALEVLVGIFLAPLFRMAVWPTEPSRSVAAGVVDNAFSFCLAVPFFLVAGRAASNAAQTTIHAEYRRDRTPFFRRNRDQLMVGIITAAVTTVLAGGLGIFIAHVLRL